MSQITFTIKGDKDAAASFVFERLVKPSLAAASAERAELMISDQMNDMRRAHDNMVSELKDENSSLADELELAQTKIDLASNKAQEMEAAIKHWQHCAFALQSKMEAFNEKPSEELKGKIFALLDLLSRRERLKSIQAIRSITGSSLNEGKVMVERVFENYTQVSAEVIPLPASELDKSEDTKQVVLLAKS